MIEKITITNPDDLIIYWWNDVKTLKNKKIFTFKPGINIIVGKNASGKSTLLKLIARHFHCEQGGISYLTNQSIHELFGFKEKKKYKGYKITHDGQPVGYYSPDKEIGVHGSAFDDDFMHEGIESLFTRDFSQGQKTIRNISNITKKLSTTNEIKCSMNKDSVNDYWVKKIDNAYELLNRGKTLKLSKKTILLDEPERSLDLENELAFFSILEKIKDKYQIIIATHSPYAFFISDAHYIEITRGYRNSIKKQIKEKIHGG